MTRVVFVKMTDLRHDGRLEKQARTLVSAGVQVVWVGVRDSTEDLHYDEADGVSVRRVDVVKPEALAALRARETALAGAPEPQSLSQGVRRWLGRWRQAWLVSRAVEREEPEVLVAANLDALMVTPFLRNRPARVVYDMHELWVDQFEAASRSFRWLFSVTESHLLRHYVTTTIAANQARADVVSARYPGAVVHVVTNYPFITSMTPQPVSNPVRVLYQGMFDLDRGLIQLIEAMALCDEGSVRLTLQGWGSGERLLCETVDRLGLSGTVAFSRPAHPNELIAAANQHDIGFVSYSDANLNSRLCSPNKLFDYMQAGLAILGRDLPTIRAVVTDCGNGLLFERPTAESVSQALKRLVSDRSELGRMKQASAGASARYSWESQEPVLLQAVLGVG